MALGDPCERVIRPPTIRVVTHWLRSAGLRRITFYFPLGQQTLKLATCEDGNQKGIQKLGCHLEALAFPDHEGHRCSGPSTAFFRLGQKLSAHIPVSPLDG